MWEALGHVLLISVALALSTVPIMATILILLSENKRRSSVPYLIGWVLGIAAIVTGFTVVAAAIPTSSPMAQPMATGIGEIVIGLALVTLAVIVWRRSRGRSAGDEPKWFSAVDSLGPWSSCGLGFVLNLRPKSILLSAAAGLSLRADGLTVGGTATVIAIYTALAASTVGLLVIATLISPVKAEARLVRTRATLSQNRQYISMVMLLMIGVAIVGNGLTHL